MDPKVHTSRIETNSSQESESEKAQKIAKRKDGKLSQLFFEIKVNTKLHRSRETFLNTIGAPGITNKYEYHKIKMAAEKGSELCTDDNRLFNGLVKESIHRRIRRLTADIEQDHGFDCENESNKSKERKISNNVTFDLNKNMKRLLLEKIRLRRERRLKNCSLRLLGKMIVYSRRLMDSMASFSYENTPKTSIVEAWELSNVHNEPWTDGKMNLFNLEEFTKNAENVGCEVPAWAKEVLHKHGSERCVSDIYCLLRMLSILKKFNDKFTYSVRAVMCRMFRYVKFPKRRVILREGHVGYEFYVIYTGSVFVNKQVFNSATHKNEWKTVNVLRRGDSFGELALLRLNSFRSATIVTREDTEFLVVSRDVFNTVCPKALDAELDVKIDLIRETRVFQIWSNASLRALCLDSKVNQYPTNTVIVGNDLNDERWLYICLEGKCMAVKRVVFQKNKHRSKIIADAKNRRRNTLKFPNILSSASSKEDDIMVDWKSKYVIQEKYEEENSIKDVLDHTDEAAVLRARLESSMENLKTRKGEVDDWQEICTDKHQVNIMMNVAQLTTGDIFNFSNFLKDDEEDNETMLVSLGCKIVQIKRETFFCLVTNRNLVFAKEIAETNKYPDNSELVQKYKENQNWKTYRNNVIHDIINKRKLKRSNACEESKCSNSPKEIAINNSKQTTTLPPLQMQPTVLSNKYNNKTIMQGLKDPRRGSLTVAVLNNAYHTDLSRLNKFQK